MTTDLISKNITAVQLFSENGLDPVLDKIKAEIDNFEADISTDKTRKEIASFARKIASSKVFIEKAGKELVSGIKAKSKLIDAERKRSRDTLDQWRDEVRQPLTDYEAEQEKIKELERQKIEFDMDHEEALGMEDLFKREKIMADKEAALAKQESDRLAKEESDRLEKERIDREAQIKADAESKAKQDAQDEIIAEREAKEKAEHDKIQAELDAKEAKKQAERDRIAAEEKAKADQEAAVQKTKDDLAAKAKASRLAEENQKAEDKRVADKKAANTRHQAHINKKVMASLIATGITEAQARVIIIEIAQGRIEFLSIKY